MQLSLLCEFTSLLSSLFARVISTHLRVDLFACQTLSNPFLDLILVEFHNDFLFLLESMHISNFTHILRTLQAIYLYEIKCKPPS